MTTQTLPKQPLIPAFLLPEGAKLSRTQSDGKVIHFQVRIITFTYEDVHSKLDDYSSTWYSRHKKWVQMENEENE